ncbi:type II toxin-antitoxin system VapC family toxin [Methylomagnum ishizawai]|uniref:type II toxin-antitoxin system VapC family toxin n=1 Tax=Methylomagnum ishizawai TaxID=1760988 RepID=UPI001C31FF99|nr:type II toxin-antitoxin system VapC family toxin [Methylomagnum ishizawai]BBL76066.1 hypothetical protein MishRS11D_31640 [Methylomagnum ishizawai]
MLLDSNLIIYSIKPEYIDLRKWIAENTPSVSAISYLEVMGYHRLTAEDKQDFSEFFSAAPIIPVTQPILEQAVKLRQQRKMSLGDAIVAGTAMVLGSTLATANTKDFEWIAGLTVLDPVKNISAR